jgi:AraC family transcriptional regulator
MLTDPPGVILAPASPRAAIVLHVGPAVHIACDRDGRKHRGRSVHGDVDIIPIGTPSRWELKEQDTALVMALSAELLQSVARESRYDPASIQISNRFQIRDRQIEAFPMADCIWRASLLLFQFIC